MVNKAVSMGEAYVDRADDKVISQGMDVRTPPLLLALIPMVIVIFCINFSLGGEKICSVETGVLGKHGL